MGKRLGGQGHSLALSGPLGTRFWAKSARGSPWGGLGTRSGLREASHQSLRRHRSTTGRKIETSRTRRKTRRESITHAKTQQYTRQAALLEASRIGGRQKDTGAIERPNRQPEPSMRVA